MIKDYIKDHLKLEIKTDNSIDYGNSYTSVEIKLILDDETISNNYSTISK